MVQQIKGPEEDSAPGDKFQDLHNFPKGSAVKNLPPRQEIQVQSLGWEGSLENGMATHSSILEIPCPEEPSGIANSQTQLSD